MSLKTAVEGFFEKIGSFFEHLFGKAASAIQAVLTNIGPLINEALPIVEEVSTILTGVDMANPNAVLTKIEEWLGTVIKDTSVVQGFVTANSGAPLVNVIQNAATLVLGHTAGTTSTVLKDLQLAVQLAYAAFSHSNPTTTGAQTVAAIASPSAKVPVK